MSDAETAIHLWGQLAPRYNLTLSHDSEGYDASALDRTRDQWVTVMYGPDLIETMLVACTRVQAMQPGGQIQEHQPTKESST